MNMPVIKIQYENPEICIDDPRDLEAHFSEHSDELQYRIVDEIDCYDEDGDEMYPNISSFRVVKFNAQPSDDDYPNDEWKSITAKVSVRYYMEYR
jgi:hypothetical protein